MDTPPPKFAQFGFSLISSGNNWLFHSSLQEIIDDQEIPNCLLREEQLFLVF